MTERDYRIMYWGHACKIDRKAGPEENLFSGYIFGSAIKPGDTILLKMQSGKVGILELDELKHPGDPWDMYLINSAHFVGYKE